MLEGYYIKKLGQNKGAPRVWLEGTQASRAGFEPGQKYDVVVQGRTICLTANKDGTRVVSSKKKGEKVNPVIDLNGKELLALFDGMSAIRVVAKKGEIYLVPLATELKKQERSQRLRAKLENGEPLAIGSSSHGGGILSHAIHQGLKQAGVESKIAFANEIREELLEHAAVHNDAWSQDTKIYAAPIQELAFDDRGVATLPRTEIFESGIPCEASSLSGLAKGGHKVPEAHEHVGHLVVSTLILVGKVNPAICVFECVPNYFHTASAAILRTQLKDLGYTTHECVLNGKEWGALENRNRWCMIGVTDGIQFDLSQLMPPRGPERTLGDVLDAVPDSDPRWSPMQGLKDKAVRDAEAGKGFKMQIVTEESDQVGTIGKGYMKRRSTEPMVQNANNPDMLRLLTPSEHARVKGIPEHLIDGLSDTLAHEVLGQSVIHPAFVGVGQHVGEALMQHVGKAPARRAAAPAAPPVAPVDQVDEIPREFVDMAKEVVSTLKRAELGKVYVGQIVAVDRNFIIQDVGRQTGILHDTATLDQAPKLGVSVKIQYDRSQGRVVEPAKKQLSLAL